MKKRHLKLLMADIKHKSAGIHSSYIPIGIGYIGSYSLSRVGKENADLKLFTDPDEVIKCIDTWKPDVIGMANYCWNSEGSYRILEYAKNLNPDIVCIAGGPDFPEMCDAHEYMDSRSSYLDFYAYKEGEDAFADLMIKLSEGNKLIDLKKEKQTGMMSIHPENNNLVVGAEAHRISNMDVIPSPYLSGMLDQFLNGKYVPSFETARGCPFSCTFCYQGDDWFNKIAKFSVERIKDELTYIAKRMTNHGAVEVRICDSNFGMYKRDEEFGEHIRHLQDEYGWPNSMNVSTGKGNWDRIIRISERVRHAFSVGCSVQSMFDGTLESIKRRNMPPELYKKVVEETKKREGSAMAETILPLPNETKKSFFEGLEILANAGIEKFVPHTTMILKGTKIASKEHREKYNITTRFRLLPKQFGEYKGKKIFEVEEVCISTNTMSFEEYLECKGFSFICTLFAQNQYEAIRLLVEEANIKLYDYYFSIWKLITSEKTPLTKIYNDYINESKSELFLTKEDLYDYYSDSENYKKLVAKKLGKNLIRKYLATIVLKEFSSSIEIACHPLKSYFNKSDGILESLENWTKVTRDMGFAFSGNNLDINNDLLSLNYDVNAWYKQKDKEAKMPLINFKKQVKYQVTSNNTLISEMLDLKRNRYNQSTFDLVEGILARANNHSCTVRFCTN